MNKDRDNRKEALGELVRFALVGGLATLLHWLIYWGMLPWCNAYVAYSAAYMLSFLFNFLATSYVTFRSRPTWTRLWGMAGRMWSTICCTWCCWPSCYGWAYPSVGRPHQSIVWRYPSTS